MVLNLGEQTVRVLNSGTLGVPSLGALPRPTLRIPSWCMGLWKNLGSRRDGHACTQSSLSSGPLVSRASSLVPVVELCLGGWEVAGYLDGTKYPVPSCLASSPK